MKKSAISQGGSATKATVFFAGMKIRNVWAILAMVVMTGSSQALTYTWDPTNVTGTPTATLDWFTGGSNPLGLWTGPVVPVSASDTEIRFFPNTTTSLPNTAVPSTQTANLNNGGSAFQLGTLTLNGFGSATSGASLTMTLQGDALNFSGATGTISFNSVKNVAPATDPVINYTINNNIQLGAASSGSVLTLTGNGDSAGTTTYNIGGAISELLGGGGSLLKSGSSLVTDSGAVNITGGVTVSAGRLTLSSSTITASTMTVNGGTLILTGNLTPASGSMTVNTGGILQIGNNTATQFGAAGVYSGNISTGTGGTLRLWSSSSQEISGIISGSGGINKAYGGALTLSGANTYSGRTSFQPANTAGFTANVSSFNSVVGGTASSSLGAPTTVANGTVDIGSGTAQASVNLTYTGAAALGETTDRVMNIIFNSNSSQTITANNGAGLLRFTSAFTSSPTTGSGSLTLRGTGQGQIDLGLPQLSLGGLIKNDAGTWMLGGSGTFTQPTTISAGTLNLTSATALQNSPFNTASASGTGSVGLKIATTTLTLGGLTGSNALKGRFTTALGGPSNATANGGYAGLTDLTLNTVAGSTIVYTGAIAEGATGMSLTKTGAGIQTLNATHTYTGTTFVNGGLLQLNGNTLAGGLSVSSATLLSNSSFGGVSSVTSGGVISPGASSGTIGTVTINNASASALTLSGSTGIFDLPSTVTTPDQIVVTGGLVLNNSNTILLKTPLTGTPAGVYNLITSGATPTGAGSFVLANGSATRGNATVSISGNNVILTVAAGGLVGTTTYIGTTGNYNQERWFLTGNWNSGAVPTGTTDVVLPDQTSGFTIPAFSTSMPTYSGDLWIGNNVTLQVGSTTANAVFNNAYGTPGSTIIYMGANSAIAHRNSGFNPTIPAIVLLGDASMRFQESTQGKADPNFANSISGNFTLTLNSGNGNGFSTHTLNAANSFAGLNLAGAGGVVNAAASGSIGTANLTISGGGTVNLNHATAISDNTNPIRIDNGTVNYGTTAAASLTLSTRPIQLNGAGQATIKNSNTASSSANIMTLGGGISSTAAGAKTLTLGGANTGANTVSGNIVNGSGTITLTKADDGTWVLSGANTYTGVTTISAGKLEINSLANVNGGASALGNPTSVANGTIAIGSTTTAGTLRYTGTGHTSDRVINLAGTTGGATLDQSGTGLLKFTSAFTATGVGVKTLTLQGSTAGTGEINAAIVNSSSASALIKAGTGTWILSGANTYTGATAVNGGMLVFGKKQAKASATVTAAAAGSIGLGVSASDSAYYSSSELDSLYANTLSGFTMNAASGVGIDTTAGDFTYASNITANRALTKLGANKLTLSGANTYNATTTILAGTLALGNPDVMPNASAILIGAAMLDAQTYTDTCGTLDVTDAATINLGANGKLIFADSRTINSGTWAGTLNITGAFLPGSSIKFGSTSGSLTAAQLAKITVNGRGAGKYWLNDSGYLTTTQPTLISFF